MRQRGPNSWQLRVYVGLDASSGKPRYATRTVTGGVRAARRELEAFVEEAERERLHADSVAELLDRWLEDASSSWSPGTKRETKSLVEHPSSLSSGISQSPSSRRPTSTPSTERSCAMEVTMADRSLPAPCTGSTSCSTERSPRRFAGDGSGSTP